MGNVILLLILLESHNPIKNETLRHLRRNYAETFYSRNSKDLPRHRPLMHVMEGQKQNVAVSLSQYGIPATFVSRVPSNELGTSAIRAMAAFGIDTQFIQRGGERLGIYFLETGASARASQGPL